MKQCTEQKAILDSVSQFGIMAYLSMLQFIVFLEYFNLKIFLSKLLLAAKFEQFCQKLNFVHCKKVWSQGSQSFWGFFKNFSLVVWDMGGVQGYKIPLYSQKVHSFCMTLQYIFIIFLTIHTTNEDFYH